MKQKHGKTTRRTVLALTGTTRAMEAKLCGPSALALDWSMAWARQQDSRRGSREGQRVPHHAVIRRALLLYAQRLESSQDPGAELRALHAACTPFKTCPAAQEAAEARLVEAVAAGDLGELLPPLDVVLNGADSRAQVDAFNARAEAIADAIEKEPGYRRAAAAHRAWAKRKGITLAGMPPVNATPPTESTP